MAPPLAPAPTSEKVEVQSLSDDFSGMADNHTTNLTVPSEARASEAREVSSRLNDDLELLRAERLVSNQEHQQHNRDKSNNRAATRRRSPERSEDAFNARDELVAEKAGKTPPTFLNKVWKKIRSFPRILRYAVYMIIPGTVLLTPVLLGLFAFNPGSAPIGGPGGLYLLWFGIWLEIVWGSFWVSRMLTSLMPAIFGFVASVVGSVSSKKWKDIGRQLELDTALFIWLLAVLVSFNPITDNHRVPSGDWSDGPPYIVWIDVINKVIIAFFVLAVLNLVEKLLIQWIATSFHLRTYSSRIEINRREIDFLTGLFEHSKQKFERENSIWNETGNAPSGAMTPIKALQHNAKHVLSKVGGAAGRVVDDFTGRKVNYNHPRKVIMELLRTTAAAHTLARLIYRSLIQPERSTIVLDDFKGAFPTAPEDAETAFNVFDKDLNGDISMEELEVVCNEIHLEKKAIAASLKDLDSVIKKLDKVFLFIIFIIAAIVFVSIISGSAAAALTSAGTTLLGLAWMLQATAQEFLQSIIFVFVKHPFDVGDRVTVYGNTGSMMKGDDYYVTEISLLYTEFKKMEGHIVQAPNSLLNTLFILNQRRSASLADPIELKMRFGTPVELIDALKDRMLAFVTENKRDYQARIITEIRTLDEVHSCTMNLIFFHKSNFQNELIRLTRHNRFATELMAQMSALGIEGPRRMEPGGNRDWPLYWAGAAMPPSYDSAQQQQGQGYAGPQANFPATSSPITLRSPLHPPQGQAQAQSPTQRDQSPVQAAGVSAPFPQLMRIASPGSAMSSAAAAAAAAATASRRRADSRVSAVTEVGPDFQDVYESRKGEASVARLQSIRQGERLDDEAGGGARVAAAAGSEETGSGRLHYHFSDRDRGRGVVSSSLAHGGGRATSMETTAPERSRRGIFGRGRRAESTGRQDGGGVV